jgi:hypothetical protein
VNKNVPRFSHRHGTAMTTLEAAYVVVAFVAGG